MLDTKVLKGRIGGLNLQNDFWVQLWLQLGVPPGDGSNADKQFCHIQLCLKITGLLKENKWKISVKGN